MKKNATCQEDDNATGFPLDYNYFNDYYKMIPLDLTKEKQNCFENHLILIQKQYFIENLSRQAGTTIFFIIKEAKETILDFLRGTVIVLRIYLTLI